MGYDLTIIGHPPGLVAASTSVGTWALALKAEFSKIDDVSVHLVDAGHPETWPDRSDVALLFTYSNHARMAIPFLKRFRLTSSFREVIFNVDIPFLFHSSFYKSDHMIYFPVPFQTDPEKTPEPNGGVLIDHWWPGQDESWPMGLYEVLEPISSEMPIAQCERKPEDSEKIPPWVTRIPVQEYNRFLSATVTYRYFVLTHGGYNFSVVDMCARRKIVMGHSEFVMPEHFTRCGVVRTDSPQAVVRLIHENRPPPPIPPDITPVRDAVRTMDATFRQRLSP